MSENERSPWYGPRWRRVRSFLIIYRTEAKPLQVVRVLHAARDVQTILEGYLASAR